VPRDRVEYELLIRDKATGKLKKLSDILKDVEKTAASTGKRASASMFGISKGMRDATRSASQLERTLGRLQRTIIAFVGVWIFRKITQGFSSLVSSGIEFNKTLEQTRIGIGAVLAAQTKIIDATGRELQGREKVLAAQRIAVKINEDLLKANLETAATYQQLITMFQQALPHALAEGFNIKQVEEFVVAMSQAATAMGIPLNMMAEEMRAMLKGTITAKNTLIATALGMERGVIKKLQGRSEELFDYIMERLRAFQLSAPDTVRTWEAAFTNMKQAFSQSVGEALNEFFDTNKETMRELADFFRSENFKEGVKALGMVMLRATQLVAKLAEVAGKEQAKNVVPFWLETELSATQSRIEALEKLKKYAEGGGGLTGKAFRLLGGIDKTPEEYQQLIDALRVKLEILHEEEQRYRKEQSKWYQDFLKLQRQIHREALRVVGGGRAGQTEEDKAAEEHLKAQLQRIREHQKMLAREQEAFMRTIEQNQQEALRSLGETGYNAAQKLEEALADPDRFFGPLRDTLNFMPEVAEEAARNMQQAFTDFFFDAMQGEMDSFKDYLRSFATAVQRSLAGILAQKFVEGAGGFLGDIKGSLSSGFSWADFYHKGGIAGKTPVPTRPVSAALFANAPRLHNGLAPDEFPAILQRGETVLPRGAGGVTNIYIYANDAKSFQDQMRENRAVIIESVSEHLSDGGHLRNVIREVT